MREPEYHVASYVVRTRPQDASALAQKIEAMPGLEVHVSEQGKLVVTAEAGGARELAELTAQLERLEAVVTVSPVYHEYTRGDDLTSAPGTSIEQEIKLQ